MSRSVNSELKQSGSNSMKTVLLRYYSANNLGDDLFVKLIAERYRNKFLVIMHYRASSLLKLSNLKIYKAKVNSILINYVENSRFRRKLWYEYLAKKCDLMVYIGGSIFKESGNLKDWRQEPKFYKRLKIPYYFVSSNFGPYETQEFVGIVKGIINNSEDACFRDNASGQVFGSRSNVSVASDVVFSLDISKYKVQTKKLVIFSIIDCEERVGRSLSSRYEDEIIRLTKQFISHGYEVNYMSFCKIQGDEKACYRILSKIDDKKIRESVLIYSYEGNLEEALSMIASCEVIVGTRFHANVLGLVFNKKVIPIIYSSKTTEVLKDIGFTGPILDLTKSDGFKEIKINSLKQFNVNKQIINAQYQFKALDKVLTRSEKDE
jgi:colanic acid/amylovoran biosynthesis protein